MGVSTSNPVKYATVALAGLAVALAGVLLYQSQTHEVLPGCGGDGGCGDVFESQWSVWFGIPVSLPALLVYTALAGAAFVRDPKAHRPQPPAEWVMALASVMAIGAALWFITVQVAFLGSFCIYCISTHALGVTAAVLGLLAARPMLSLGSQGTAAGTAAVMLSVLIVGQFMSAAPESAGGELQLVNADDLPDEPLPDLTQPIDNTMPDPLWQPSLPDNTTGPITNSGTGTSTRSNTTTTPDPPRSTQTSGSRKVLLYGGRLEVDTTTVPVIGDPYAPNVLLVLYDYTCHHCRDTRVMLEKTQAKHGNQLAIVCLPTPLNSKCNRLIQRYSPGNRHGCDLAKISLAVWNADPKKWREFDQELYSNEDNLTGARAKLIAWKLVGEKDVEAELKNDWIDQQINRNVTMYGICGQASGKMTLPMLVTKYGIITGTPTHTLDIDDLIRGRQGAE